MAKFYMQAPFFAAVLVWTVSAHPSNLQSAPVQYTDTIMKKTGLFKKTIWGLDDANALKLTCSNNEQFALFGAKLQIKHDAVTCDASKTRCYTTAIPTYPIAVQTESSVLAICAAAHGQLTHWHAATWDGANSINLLGQSGQMVKHVRKNAKIPATFYAAVVMIIAGISCHIVGRWLKNSAVKSAHYVFMPSGVIAATVGVAMAVGEDWRVAHNTPHAYFGYAALALLWANAGVGILTKYTRANLGMVHRWLGAATLGIVAITMTLSWVHLKWAYGQFDQFAHIYVSGATATLAAFVVYAIIAGMGYAMLPVDKYAPNMLL